MIRLAIKEALNFQTYNQFKIYAEHQYPNNLEQQNILINQLQEQHYQQYMQQIFQHQLLNQMNTKSNSININCSQKSADLKNELSSLHHQLDNYQNSDINSVTNFLDKSLNLNKDQINDQPSKVHLKQDDEEGTESKLKNYELEKFENENKAEESRDNGVTNDDENEDDEDDEIIGQLTSAQMWTNKDIKLFKEFIRKDDGDGIIKVGHGEILTVRVPTHPDGSCIFWEFATDNYDIGFGLLFEWTQNPGNTVSVHISESDDDEEDEDEEEEQEQNVSSMINSESFDPEKGIKKKDEDELPTSIIVPIFRRDCHEEVFAGSHSYPGKGIYLLKFDNSYSLWRSKTLYYKVYYTK